jgi:hypothetical protein
MSSEVLNELMRRSESLTDEEKMRLASHLASQARQSQAGESEVIEDGSHTMESDPDRWRERQWLLEHGGEYAGEWVALNGDCLLAHGTDGRLVLSEARRAGVDVPFVVRVESTDELPFGGW